MDPALRRGPLTPGVLRLPPPLILALTAGPVAAGLLGALGPAFGWMPALGATEPGLSAWRDLLSWPGLGAALLLSAVTGVAGTALSLGCALLIAAALGSGAGLRRAERLLAPMLAIPHAAAAFGLAFLIAPSGWILRALSPWATGFDRPPDWLILNDPGGLALIAGLVLKETPFLLLTILAALPQTDAARSLTVARSLGYGPVAAWVKVVLPRLYPQIRLPVLAALAYSASTVDMAMILGPSAPPTLAVQIVAWMGDPDLALRPRAAAAALLLGGLTLGLIGLWRIGEIALAAMGRRWIAGGGRRAADGALRAAGLALLGLLVLATCGALAALAAWSTAELWVFPETLPEGFTARHWAAAGPALAALAARTALIAAAATAAGLALALLWLEAERRAGRRRQPWPLFAPLLVPQAAFLPGLQALALGAGLDGGLGAVIAAHALFVAPYVYLVLADPWRAWDERAGLAAAALGAGPWRVFWAVRAPMLARAVLTAAAVGFAVSVAQYLPTLLIGGGRTPTLTTEAVALAAGGDRRLIGATALAQAALPFAGFALALGAAAALARRRRGLAP
ncbi:ABC transporter permease [Rubrimonas sp.]|uniref:ABC transporter permease n=1 Tax=Rubrimonas sp. TaxID=2036015 RepID=UPI002FDD6607